MAQRERKTGRTRYPGIYRRNRSKYYWIVYTTPDGRKHRESTKTTSLMEAVQLRALRMAGLTPLEKAEEQLLEKPEPRTLGEFAPEYLAVQKHLKSYDTLRGRVEALVEALGTIPMEELSAKDYELYRAKRLTAKRPRPRQKKGLGPCKPATVNRELSILKNMLKKARTYGYISRDAVERITAIRPLREENTIIRYLSQEEEDRLICSSYDLSQEQPSVYGHLYPIVLTAIRTGMRKGEILGLKREDVNLEKRIIHVTRSKGGGRRDVPIPADLVEVLRGVLGGHCMDHVFWHGKGNAEAYKNIKGSFKRALRKARITNFRFHDLRHHYASTFVMNGGNILHLQKILGHQSIEMTMRYAHLAPDFIQAATKVLDEHSAKSSTHFVHTREKGGEEAPDFPMIAASSERGVSAAFGSGDRWPA